ncbi:MAG: hypothetical protein M3P91_11945 [Actinomycetota bacterium]|nr:hypothetical protein [Actinomycetota bacterium]
MNDEQLRVLRLLLDQAGGVALIEGVMDEEAGPGSHRPPRRGERPAVGNAHGLLAITWVDLAHEIPPLLSYGVDKTRTADSRSAVTVRWRLTPPTCHGSIATASPTGVVCPVEQPCESKYTLGRGSRATRLRASAGDTVADVTDSPDVTPLDYLPAGKALRLIMGP